jgi:hypothetical protein
LISTQVVILAWWNSPEDQAMFASMVLCLFAVAAAWVRPETEGAVNLTELAGVGISIFVVALGLSFTAHHRESNADGKDLRYVGYFATVQILFLLGAMRATVINVRAVRARMAVEKRVAALHDGVVRARRRGTLLSQESRILREAMSSDTTTSPRTPLERLRRAFSSDDATASPRTPRGFASIDSPASSASGRMRANIRKLARKMSTLRGSTSLTGTQVQQLEGHGREIEELAEGRLEVLHTFKGPPLRAYMRARDSTDVRALLAFVNLERRMGPTVADDSSVGNFSRQHEARFYHELAQALPGLLDYVLCADRDRRRALSAVISDVAAFDGHRHDAGARPLARLLIEPIDRPSVLYFSIHATQDELVCLRVVVDGMVSASPRILAQVEAVRARTRLAVRVQRAWRRHHSGPV